MVNVLAVNSLAWLYTMPSLTFDNGYEHARMWRIELKRDSPPTTAPEVRYGASAFGKSKRNNVYRPRASLQVFTTILLRVHLSTQCIKRNKEAHQLRRGLGD